MTGPFPVFPNIERLIVSFLTARPEMDGVTVDLALPVDSDGDAPAVVPTRIGGRFVEYQQLDQALVEIATYGPDKESALDLAMTVRGLLASLPDGSPVTDVAEDTGPRWQSDPDRPKAARYITQPLITVRPAGT
jgi:hypothetical protein